MVKVLSTEDWEDDLRVPNTPASPGIRMTLEFERQDGEIRKLNICEVAYANCPFKYYTF